MSSSEAPDQTKTNIKVGGMVHGTQAICAALMQNPKLADLVGVPNPSTLLYASGTVTNNVFGLNNVPGCQVGIDPTSTHAVVAWGFCNYPDPQGLSDNGPIWGTSNVYTLSAAANGVFIVLGQTTSVAMMEGTAGSSSESVVLPAIRDAAAIFQADGGCASS